ncbi:MAG TPA: fused MFS/spermidine synthase [bacterium]|nr:fused MFS/spermidine synthase [bacterium]HPL95740.1 fused MFS/spermidine synthase [bacterium]
MKIKNYVLEIAVFVCGAVVMIFELVGSRVLGPYFGTSIFVWTGLIGIILGSLSIGYYWGGKIADKKTEIKILSLIILLSAVTIGLINFFKDFLLTFLQLSIENIKISTVIASIILFSPPSVLLGMVSPYAAKIKLNNLNTSGSVIGNLYALSTAGSIVGTFFSGFYLIPHFGTSKLLIILALVLIVTSVALTIKNISKIKLLVLMLIIMNLLIFNFFNKKIQNNNFVDIDTAYNRVWIYNRNDPKTNKSIRIMGINNENHSAMFLDSDELVNQYTKYFHLAKHFNPGFKKTLMLGGAGYSYPKEFLIKYPEATMDVVEIDSKITELAKKYFNLRDDPRLTIYHEDGRMFLNRTSKKYDVIWGDAFASRHSLPYNLTTKEAVKKKYNLLNEGGVVVLNIISALAGEKSDFLKAEYKTYKAVFPQVYLFPVNKPSDDDVVQNIILIALKTNSPQDFNDPDQELNNYLQHRWMREVNLEKIPILSDDFAPTDYYISKTL